MSLNFRQLWGRITGKDKKATYPDQQCSVLGRLGDFTVVYPYGLYCDLPNDVLIKQVAPGAVISTTVKRPDDIETGEPVIFHPPTNTRIILRNNGDIDIIASGKKINMTCDEFNVTATSSVNILTPLMTISDDIINDGKDISNTHTHVGSPSAPEGAVSNTGVVI